MSCEKRVPTVDNIQESMSHRITFCLLYKCDLLQNVDSIIDVFVDFDCNSMHFWNGLKYQGSITCKHQSFSASSIYVCANLSPNTSVSFLQCYFESISILNGNRSSSPANMNGSNDIEKISALGKLLR